MKTMKMSRPLALAAVLVLCSGALIGCTKADKSDNAQNTAGNQAPAASSTSTAAASNASGNAVAGAGTAVDLSSVQGSDSSSTQNSQSSQNTQSTQSVQNTSASGGSGAQSVNGTTIQTASGNTTQQQVTPAPAPAPAQSVGASEEFTGEFEKTDGSESVVIMLEQDNLISFRFSESMINGNAQTEGSNAVYQGDDGYTITFNVAGDTLMVEVGGEDAETNNMNGIYMRVISGEDDSDDTDDAVEEDLPDEGDGSDDSFYDAE